MKNKQFNLFSSFTSKYLEETDELVIEGLANSTVKDRMGDVIVQEAWTKGGLRNYFKNPIVLAFHDHSKPIGKVTGHSITSEGFRITATISKAAGEVRALISDKVLSAFSIGFMIKDAEYDSATDTFFIRDLELLEVSVVSVPANQDSIFSVSKSFEHDSDYEEFKKSFEKVEETVETEKEETVKAVETKNASTLEEKAKELESESSKTEDMLAELIKSQTDLSNKITEVFEKTKSVEPKVSTELEKENMTVEVKESGVEKLYADLEERFEAKNIELADALEGIRSELKEKSEELDTIRKAKMEFTDRGGVTKATHRDIDDAVLLAKCLGSAIDGTTLGKSVVEKSGAEHWHDTNASEDWEQEFASRVLDEMRMKLIVGELFSGRTIKMNTTTMHIPTNPEAGLAAWINPNAFRSNDNSSTGTAVDHELGDISLTSHKLASKEYIGYEEEEDSIIPILGFIRDAVVRRMARKWDQTLIHGASGGVSATDPIIGVGTQAQTAASVYDTKLSLGGNAKVTVADLQTARRGLGNWGLNPTDVIYVVSTDAYWDLLDDPDFRTVDMVGSDKATILRGQIGQVNGSPVVVSAEFLAKAAGAECVLALNVTNFLVGEQRSLMIERDRNIEDQRNIIVATRRLAFTPIQAAEGVSILSWEA